MGSDVVFALKVSSCVLNLVYTELKIAFDKQDMRPNTSDLLLRIYSSTTPTTPTLTPLQQPPPCAPSPNPLFSLPHPQ